MTTQLQFVVVVELVILTPWSRVLEKLTGLQLVKKFPHFMEPEVSLPHSQVPTICSYPEPARSGPYPHIPLPEDIHLNIILPSVPGSPQWSLSLRFIHQNPVHASPLLHTRHMPCQSYSSEFCHSHNIG